MKTGHERDISYRFAELLEVIAYNPKCSDYFGIERASEECGDGSSGEPRAAVTASAETTNSPENADASQTPPVVSVSSIVGHLKTSDLGRKLSSVWRWVLSGAHAELDAPSVNGSVLGGPPRPFRR